MPFNGFFQLNCLNYDVFKIIKGYPKQLLPIMVHGVPSMHICLEFAPKLLAHYELEKQVCKMRHF